ncbi:hypothetical protein ACA910_019844 [Epithemia clementina (nom. ined.)]
MLRAPRVLVQQVREAGRCLSIMATTSCVGSNHPRMIVNNKNKNNNTNSNHHNTTTIRAMSGAAVMVKRRPRKEDYGPEIQKIVEGFPSGPMQRAPRGTEYSAPVTSAHMVQGNEVSTLDSAVLNPDNGSVIHGRYGVLPEPAASSIPLEYLALLRPAAEGAAAFRALTEASRGKKGTVLVYGASEVNGLSCCQMANKAGHAVIAVVASNHSGNEDMMFSVKHLLDEPGTAIPQEVSVVKSIFRDLVQGIVTGHEGYADLDPEGFLKEFKTHLQQYSEYYPNTRPGAVQDDVLQFKPEYMEKDREQWDANISTYVKENYPPGAPPVDLAKLNAFFTPQQYEIFRQKFWHQNGLVVAGVDVKEMNPPDVVQEQIRTPEDPAKALVNASGFPYAFSLFHQESHPPHTAVKPGGPIVGAVLCVTPELQSAATAVASAPTKRAKAEALKFLSKSERHVYLSACSIVQQAAGAPVWVIGGDLPGFQTLAVTEADVQHALSSMDIDEQGQTILNFYIQSYRANDFPFYADYAVFRKNEPMTGPREYIVLK